MRRLVAEKDPIEIAELKQVCCALCQVHSADGVVASGGEPRIDNRERRLLGSDRKDTTVRGHTNN